MRLILLGWLDSVAVWHLPRPLGVLSHRLVDGAVANHAVRVEILVEDPTRYAVDLYAALHRLDDGGVATIAVLAPPGDEEWAAVWDRLTRAGA